MTGLPCLRRSLYTLSSVPKRCPPRRHVFTSSNATDSYGLPMQPTWSVNDLLTSYPSPKLSPKTIARIYALSALICPPQDTPQFETVKSELEEMIRLVEAVRLVDTFGTTVKGRGQKEDADRNITYSKISGGSGQALLNYASRTQDGYYVVNAERKR